MKPKEILDLEKNLGFDLKEVFSMEDLIKLNNNRTFMLNSEFKVIGLNLSSSIKDTDILKSFKDIEVLSLCNNSFKEITFKDLFKLKSLDLGNCTIRKLHIENLQLLERLNLIISNIESLKLIKIPKIKRINLTECIINDFYLDELNSLDELDIINSNISHTIELLNLNKIKELIINEKVIGRLVLTNLPNLTKLVLKKNEIETIIIKNIPILVDLYLAENLITEKLILLEVKALKALELENNDIKDLSIDSFNNLTDLNLCNNIFHRFSMSNLAKLKEFDLSNNKIPNIVLENLSNLKILVLRGTKIIDIVISDFLELLDLDISKNQVRSIKLNNLPKLNKLNLAYNQLKSIEIQGLVRLSNLILRNNQIEVIKMEDLPVLKELDLSNNKIKDLYPLLKFERLKIVDLDYNEKVEKDIPIETLAAGWQAVKEHIKNKNNLIEFRKVKVLLLGNTNIGKSMLLNFWKTNTIIKSESTHGIIYEKLIINNWDLELHVWDFGGQEYFHATHKLFFSPNALNLVIWGQDVPRECNEEHDICFHKEYWLRIIEQLNKSEENKQKVILVENKIDLNNPRFSKTLINEQSLAKEFLNLDIKTEYISLTELKRLDRLLEALGESCSVLINKHPSYYDVFLKRVKELDKDFITIQEVNYKSEDSAKVKAAMRVFHNMGIVLYFHDLMPEKIFVKPQTLLNLLYEKVLSEKKSYNIDRNEIEVAIRNNKLDLKTDDVINLLRYFDLVFQVRNLKDRYFIPQYLNKISLYLKVQIKRDFLYCSIKINADNYLMSLAMLKIYSAYGEFVKEGEEIEYYFWKDGLVIDKNEQLLLIKYNREKHQIELYIDRDKKNGPLQTELVEFVLSLPFDDEYERKKTSLRKQNLKSWKSDYFTVYLSSDGNHFFSYKEVNNAIETNAKKVINDQGVVSDLEHLNFLIDINTNKGKKYFLDLIENENKNERKTQAFDKNKNAKYLIINDFEAMLDKVPERPLKVFISYAHVDMEYKHAINAHLSSLIHSQIIETWDDGEMIAGQEWNETILKKLQEADVVIMLMSAYFIASNYIWEKEIVIALNNRAMKGTIVLPVLVKPFDFQGLKAKTIDYEPVLQSFITELQWLPFDNQGKLKAISTWQDRDEALSEVAKKIREAIEGYKTKNS